MPTTAVTTIGIPQTTECRYSRTYSNMDDRGIFIALGGQTVKKGAKLTGGTNDDIAAVIYNGLRLDKPVEMTDSDVFDQKAFLSQEELSKTGRDIEKSYRNRKRKHILA